MHIFRAFIADLLDKSAERATMPSWGTETLTTVGVGCIAASGQADSARKLVAIFADDCANGIQLVLLIVAIFWCGSIICSKKRHTEAHIVNDGYESERLVFC